MTSAVAEQQREKAARSLRARTVVRAGLFLPAFLLAAGLAPAAQAMTLSEALQRTAEHDPRVAASLAQYEAEREASRDDRGSLLPNVSANAEYAYARTEAEFAFGTAPYETYPSWNAAVTARQPLFRLDWFARLDRARALDARAETGLEERRLDTMRRVAERYFSVLVAQDELAQAEAEARAVRESLGDTRKRYEVELVPGTDLKEAQARDDLAQARLLAARRRLETERDALAEITGGGREPLPRLPERVVFPTLTPAQPQEWVAAARAHSPAIARARQAIDVAAADRVSRRSDAMPALDLVAQASHSDSTDYALGQLQDDQRVGLQLNVPIYAGGINQARVRRAEAGERQAEAELQRVTQEVERSTRQYYRDAESAYAESEAYARSLSSAQAAQEATRAGYEAGTRTITDVLDAQSRLVQTRRDLNGARYRLLLSVLQLKQTAGVLSPRDFAEIDRLLKPAVTE